MTAVVKHIVDNPDLLVWLFWLGAIVGMFLACWIGQLLDERRARKRPQPTIVVVTPVNQSELERLLLATRHLNRRGGQS